MAFARSQQQQLTLARLAALGIRQTQPCTLSQIEQLEVLFASFCSQQRFADKHKNDELIPMLSEMNVDDTCVQSHRSDFMRKSRRNHDPKRRRYSAERISG